ncbi:response regulator [Spirosoma montaniterrae]|uniref:Histidine kinase n=1 Tax=Spirosoma montaniterrae TaxID=1178516 RepID=A0A1P9WVU0_9BACT|nr:response regulator [Spirosoma montaniterrae]AQG79492.1 histidine kinase [Spirosoma montaniterrae]
MPKPIHCILLIDDDPDDNFYHQLVITESGLCETVRIAENGMAAMRYLAQPEAADYERPDVIFLDINMPGMNGFEFLEEYHRLPEELKSLVLVMMLTTSINPADRGQAAAFEVVRGYYAKPLTTGILAEIVARYFPE